MNNYTRFIIVFMALVLALGLSSCQKDEYDSSAIEADLRQPTFSELVTYGTDGSFSASLTGDEMAYIMEHEFDAKVASTAQPLHQLFARKMFERSPVSGDAIEGQEKTTTYGVTALVITTRMVTINGIPQVLTDFRFEGIGGLSAGDTFTAEATRVNSISSTVIMSAFSYVFTSDGDDYPLSYNDSSFDKSCAINRPFYKGRAKMTFNGIGNYNGFAVITCDRGLAEVEKPRN
ncbi:MAG: hypothetical protein AAF828_04645 [Bacteroidota bacterium]